MLLKDLMQFKPFKTFKSLKSFQSFTKLLIEIQEILEQLLPFFGEYGFGMKLNSFNGQFSVAHRHDDPIGGTGAHIKLGR